MTAPELSIIIPCKNESDNIEKTVDNIQRVLKKEPEIILVDDNSTDDTYEKLKKLEKKYPQIKVIFVRVPFEITEKRLQKRGRERGNALNNRLDRARKNQDPASADYVVDNSGDLAVAGKSMLEFILKTTLYNKR